MTEKENERNVHLEVLSCISFGTLAVMILTLMSVVQSHYSLQERIRNIEQQLHELRSKAQR